MSRGSAIIAIMIAFVGGFAIGQVTGGGDDDGSEVRRESLAGSKPSRLRVRIILA